MTKGCEIVWMKYSRSILILSTHDVDIISVAFKASLQEWIYAYVSQSKWQRCLATLRQIRSNHRHEVKSIKLSKETYALLKNYADCLQLSIRHSSHNPIKCHFANFAKCAFMRYRKMRYTFL